MTNIEIINEIASQHMIEDIMYNLTGNDEDIKDCIQDLYIDLLSKPNDLLNSLYEKEQFKFYLTRMIINNIFSSTSTFYCKYKKRIKNKVPLSEIYDKY